MTHPNNSSYQQYAKLCVEAKENENKTELIFNCEADILEDKYKEIKGDPS